MKTNFKKIQLSFWGSILGFSLFEMLLVLAIAMVMFAGVTAMKSSFHQRVQLQDSAHALQADLRMAQLLATSRKDDYKYYGLRFYNNTGVSILQPGEPLRQGWKVVRYEPQSVTPPVNRDNFAVIKSAELNDNPEMCDKTFFTSNLIALDGTSEFQAGTPGPPKLHSIVFNYRGSATADGQSLLTSNNDTIVLSGYGKTVTMQLTPLTGHVEVGETQ